MRIVRDKPWLDDLWRDVRHGLRLLRRNPGYTAAALVTLALGIGANTAIFSVVNGVILQPLAYPAPEQLVRVTASFPLTGTTAVGLSYAEYAEYQAMNRSLAHVGIFTTGRTNTGGGAGAWTGEVNLVAGERAMRVRSAAVDHHLLNALGVQPALGRLFRPGETDAMADRPGLGGPPIAILSYELWQTAFGGRPIVGQTVNVDGRSHEILGVMPRGVDLMDTRPEIWLPIGVHPVVRQIRNAHTLNVIGRLKSGATLQAAQAELNAFLENWSERAGAKGHVPTNRAPEAEDHTLQLQPLHDAIVGDARRVIWVLQAAVALVLLIGCANLANLAMARADSRRRELGVRTALGASHGRLLRQTMTEGVLLALGGGLLGVWLARVGVQALALAYPGSLPRTSDVAIDMPVLLFALGVSIATGLLFGLAPIGLRRGRDDTAGLKDGGERSAGSRDRHHVRRLLVMAEVALAVMLVTSAGLLIRTVNNLTRIDPGFDRSRLVTFSMTLPRSVSDGEGRAEVYQRLRERLATVPGVESVTAMSDLPLNRFAQRFATRVEDKTAPNGQTSELVDYYQFVMADYFKTMSVPIVAGRAFDTSDTISLNRVAIVNETLAQKRWPKGNAVGQRLRPNLSGSMGASANPWHTVIGVAKDVKEAGVDRPTGTELYLFIDQPAPTVDASNGPWSPQAPPTMHVALRTRLPAAALSQTLEAAVREADPAVPMVRLRDMDAVFTESIRRQRLLAQLLSVFAGLALLLAAVGTYGVLSYIVTERRREIAVRMALGAQRSGVLRLVMMDGFQATVIGVAFGVAGALAVNRLIAALLYGVQPTDPVTFAVVIATILAVAAVACGLPAWRASRLDPNAVLRSE